MAVFAQTTEPRTPRETQPPTSSVNAQEPAKPAEAPKDAQSQMTLVGCVQREAEYRQAKAVGRGGAAGTGAGVGNEFVLVAASRSTSGAPPANPATPEAVGTSGSAGDAYELTGSSEGQLEQYVGRRVEIVGTVKEGASAERTRVTVGAAEPSPGAPGAPERKPVMERPGGLDVAGQDLNLREIEVLSVREAEGSCPAGGK
jgi:hypothetical protein